MRFLEAKALRGAPENKALVPGGENKADEIDATDAAQKLADEHNLDLATITGTGANGRITVDDVKAVLPQGDE